MDGWVGYSQPLPSYKCKGYVGVAAVALLVAAATMLQLPRCRGCRSFLAAAAAAFQLLLSR